jgi:hypothetical protein
MWAVSSVCACPPLARGPAALRSGLRGLSELQSELRAATAARKAAAGDDLEADMQDNQV